MPINRIEIKGYKSIRELDLELRGLNILIGANGAGKSNFISLFALLNAIVDKRLQRLVASAGGADTFLHHGHQETDAIEIELTFGANAYYLRLTPTDRDRLFFDEEAVAFHDASRYVKPYWEPLGDGHKETLLYETSQASGYRVIADYVIDALESWQVYHFHDTSRSAKVKKEGDLNDNETLHPDASNLAAFLYRLQETERSIYQRIVSTIQLVMPYFDDFVLRPSPFNPDKIRLEWRDQDYQRIHDVATLSDGTLRFICLCTLLLQPQLPHVILIDEPELGLHPYAIVLLAGLLKAAATKNAQVIVATQSVPLVNQFSHDDIVVVEYHQGQSTFKRLDLAAIEAWLDDFGIGDMWEKNIIGGRPRP